MKRIFRPFFDALALLLWIAILTWIVADFAADRDPPNATRLTSHIARCDTCSNLERLDRRECPWVDGYLRSLECNQAGGPSR